MPNGTEDVEDLLAEQREFYRADAAQSDRWLSSLVDGRNDEPDARAYRAARQLLADHLASIGSAGRVLEIAAGTGRLAETYLPFADVAVLVDSSAESLALAARRLRSSTTEIELIEDDIFTWDADGRTFDTVFFSAWLHHVPHERFDRFWATVERLIEPAGTVIFDFLDARQPSPGNIELPAAPTEGYTFYAPVGETSVRDLGGRRWRVIHNLWSPDELAARLTGRGWEMSVLGPGVLSNGFWATAARR